MTPAPTDPALNPYLTVKHHYVAPHVPQWRTCVLCGRGANASIHKDLPPDAE